MKKIIIIISMALVILFFLLSSCQTPSGEREEAGAPSFFVPQEPPAAAYTLSARLKAEEDRALRMEGTGRIVFPHNPEKPVSSVALKWDGLLLEVSSGGQKLAPEEEDPIEKDIHFFSLPRNGASRGEISLDIAFSREVEPRDNGDIYLTRWYPRLWWDGLPTRDSFQVQIDMPEGYTPASSGRLNPETGFYENPGVTTHFGLVFFRNIQVEERDAGGVLVRAFFREEEKDCALLCLETAVDVIGFYREFHGFFPFPSLTVIPGHPLYAGGYPFASALVSIHGLQAMDRHPELHWKWITAHEIGHQYWGEHVMSDEDNNYTVSWLMIGMGIVADRLYVEHRNLGDDKHESFFSRYIQGMKNGVDTTADA
ncbi:MAG: hypothetical protein R6V02_09885, partial [Candidatus Aminicenantes bacterium]